MSPALRVAAGLALALARFADAAPVPEQRLLSAQSSLQFTSRQMGVPVSGTFKRFTLFSQFDPKRLDASQISLDIDLGSVDIGNPDTEAELRKPGWFDTSRQAVASFRSSAVRATGARQFEVQGLLTIKGQSQTVRVPVALSQSGPVTMASGSFQIKRLDYRIGDGEWNELSIVANEVQIAFRLALSGMPSL